MGELLRQGVMTAAILVFAVGFPPSPASAAEKAAPAGEAAEGTEPAADAAAALKPADFWVLDFNFQKVGMVQPTEGIHKGEPYWYLLYTIENRSGKDRDAFITISARSNKKKSYSSIFLPDVEALVERKVGKSLWGKTEEVEAIKNRKDEIKAEKAKGKKPWENDPRFGYFPYKAGKSLECVAIFNKLDPDATSITITVEGLSNDLHLLAPESGPKQIESRVFVLDLERPGDEYAMNFDRIRLIRSGWSKKLTDLALPSSPEKESAKAAAKEE